jgi:hypothetical protein
MRCLRRYDGARCLALSRFGEHAWPVLFVGVPCPIEIIVQRRQSRDWDTDGPADAELSSTS